MTDWLLLTASLPTSPSGLRVRIWRALKATGCAALRDGVYILPAGASTAPQLWEAEAAIGAGGAEAHMLTVRARDAEQEAAFIALFDRSEAYADFNQALRQACALLPSVPAPGSTTGVTASSLRKQPPPDLRKTLRSLSQQLQALQGLDFFPAQAAAKAAAGLAALQLELERRLSPGEPVAAAGEITLLDKAAYQGRTWATRRRPWVDRLATAWLIRRFVDPEARFIWLADPTRCPRTALGFDFDGARFTHVGERVSFEVVMASFGLGHEPGLPKLAELVHYIDTGGLPVDEAAGVELCVRGLQAQHADDDDALLAASMSLFDTLHAALRNAR